MSGSEGQPVRRPAPAKLTLSLKVTGVRPDGYHLLDAEMVSLDLADELTFRPGDGLAVIEEAVGAGGGAGAGGKGLKVPRDDDNLVRRALRAVGRRAAVELVKRIPPGAGLGGGSADAAAVLRWAGVGEGEVGPSQADLALAAGLGADVPFCLVGGRARVGGIGEAVQPLPFAARGFLLLLAPFGVSTAAVYQAWDGQGGPTAEGPNDLEPAALAVEPRLARWRDALGDATGCQPSLAGSGSTWFVAGTAELLDRWGSNSLVVAGERGQLVAVRTWRP